MTSRLEECTDCSGDAACSLHGDRRDLELAAELGRAWARYRWHAYRGHEPWLEFKSPQIECATRVASWLALPSDEARRRTLAEHSNEFAGVEWAALHRKIRDAPYMPPSREADEHVLSGSEYARIVFRAPASAEPDLQKRSDSLLKQLERASLKQQCPACPAGGRCAYHVDYLAHRDAWLASDIGERWAQFAWQTFSHHRTWPKLEGRCATTATALVAWLPAHGDDARLRTLAEVCNWRAAMTWEAIQSAAMGRNPHRMGPVCIDFPLRSATHIVVRFRPRGEGQVLSLAGTALAHDRERAHRFRTAQGFDSRKRADEKKP